MALWRPRQEETMMQKAPLPVPLPPSHRGATQHTLNMNMTYTSAQIEELEPNYVVADTEVDTTSDEF